MNLPKTLAQQLTDEATKLLPTQELRDAYERTKPELQRMYEALIATHLQPPPKSAFEQALDQLKSAVPTLPFNFEFELPQVIGADIWGQLDRGSKLGLGKHVRASEKSFGIEWQRTSTSRHAIYKRADNDTID